MFVKIFRCIMSDQPIGLHFHSLLNHQFVLCKRYRRALTFGYRNFVCTLKQHWVLATASTSTTGNNIKLVISRQWWQFIIITCNIIWKNNIYIYIYCAKYSIVFDIFTRALNSSARALQLWMGAFEALPFPVPRIDQWEKRIHTDGTSNLLPPCRDWNITE